MKTKHKNIIGKRVHALRKAAGLTIDELAGRVATNGGTLSANDIARIESRERRVLDDEVLHLTFALGVEMNALFPKRRG